MAMNFNQALNAYNSANKAFENIIPSKNTNNIAQNPIASAFSEKIGDVAKTLKKAESTTQASLVKQADLTDVVSAVAQAEITLKTVVEVRDRLISAYQEISKMPI